MKCPECQKQGLRSQVNIGPSIIKAVYHPMYYDEDGKLCGYKDRNTGITTEFSCSNGHKWEGGDPFVTHIDTGIIVVDETNVEPKHVLTVDEIPSNNHGISDKDFYDLKFN